MLTKGHDLARVDKSGEALRHQQRLCGGAADCLQAAHQIDIRTDQGEIEPVTVADVAMLTVP